MPEYEYDEASLHPHERRLRHVSALNGVEITTERVRAARRAYYGAISYLDHHIAKLMNVLRETGHLDDTVVILTSDHGEMLGERGLWYKMNFFEGSARVPLVVSAPGRFQPARIATPVTTMDLLPTLVGLARDGDLSGVVGPLDGKSLLPMLAGERSSRDTITAEYLAEGAIAPIVMIRRDNHKLIHCPADPDQLFDLSVDPLERNNLAEDAAHSELLADLKAEVAARWDLPTLDREVRQSQQRRIAVMKALGYGVQAPWDFVPSYEASRRYIRNHTDLGVLETMARYPPVRRSTSA